MDRCVQATGAGGIAKNRIHAQHKQNDMLHGYISIGMYEPKKGESEYENRKDRNKQVQE